MAAPADFLAAERTFLAWLRTGLALMGFGFVVARFGLFLQQVELLQHTQAPHTSGLSLWFGTALIAAGILVCAFSAWRHVRVVRMLREDRMPTFGSAGAVIAIAVFLGLIGLAMAVYLISIAGRAA
jgi:putative membrane protein